MLSFEPEFHLDNFTRVKGFDQLYATWSDVFTRDDDGNHIPEFIANKMIDQSQRAVSREFGLPFNNVYAISRIACRYAMDLPGEIAEEAIDKELQSFLDGISSSSDQKIDPFLVDNNKRLATEFILDCLLNNYKMQDAKLLLEGSGILNEMPDKEKAGVFYLAGKYADMMANEVLGFNNIDETF